AALAVDRMARRALARAKVVPRPGGHIPGRWTRSSRSTERRDIGRDGVQLPAGKHIAKRWHACVGHAAPDERREGHRDQWVVSGISETGPVLTARTVRPMAPGAMS